MRINHRVKILGHKKKSKSKDARSLEENGVKILGHQKKAGSKDTSSLDEIRE